MSDFLNKVITIMLIFVMLVLSPLVVSYKTDEMLSKRMILNEVVSFIDMVKDTASITEENLNQLYINCNSYGIAVDVKVKRMIRTAVTTDGNAKTVYFAVDTLDDLHNMNVGDVVQVTINSIGITKGRRLIYTVLGIDEGEFNFSLAGAVG